MSFEESQEFERRLEMEELLAQQRPSGSRVHANPYTDQSRNRTGEYTHPYTLQPPNGGGEDVHLYAADEEMMRMRRQLPDPVINHTSPLGGSPQKAAGDRGRREEQIPGLMGVNSEVKA